MNNLTQIEEQINTLNSSLSSLKGQCSLLSEQITQHEHKLKQLLGNRELYVKSVELLNLVSEATKVKTKEGFEKIVTYALRYIYNSDYSFELEFGRRGNLSELDFNVKTPECKEPLNLLDSQAGGVLDVVSVALRIVLLELIRPRIEGMLILDESFKHLHSIPPEYLERVNMFIKEINKKFNRQIIMITGREELIKEADNLIELK